jgi:hypothetical protein
MGINKDGTIMRNPLEHETRNVLVDKIVKAYDLEAKDIADAVSLYYDAQHLRIQHANKERSEGPGELVSWFAYWLDIGESVIANKLKKWIERDSSPVEAKWAYDQIGIGPVLAAGLAAHIDVTKADSISSLWKFAGQAPGFDRKVKGEKLSYNARLKTLCWKLGESFVKVSGKEGATYGRLYADFKRDEVSRNENGQYAEAAKRELENKKFKTDNATKKRLKEGKLADAHLHARAKRRTVKVFLSHYWTKGREARGLPVREPYAQQILHHDGIILMGTERAATTEKPIKVERVKRGEKAIEQERAIHGETPRVNERAIIKEKPSPEERAIG